MPVDIFSAKTEETRESFFDFLSHTPLANEVKNKTVYIKPNFMIYLHENYNTFVSPVLINLLVEYIENIADDVFLIESNNIYNFMFPKHTVETIAAKLHLKGKIINLTDQPRMQFEYKNHSVEVPRLLNRKEHDFYLIDFAKFRAHPHFYLSLTIKNMYGCLPVAEKFIKFHKEWNINNAIACIHHFVRPDFCLIDAIHCMDIASDIVVEKKYLGHYINYGYVVGSKNPLILDMVMSKIIPIEIEKFTFYQQVQELYMEKGDSLKNYGYHLVGDSLPMMDKFKLPSPVSTSVWRTLFDKIVPENKKMMLMMIKQLMKGHCYDPDIFTFDY